MPLPVIGSVLLDGGQALRIRPGRRKVSPMSKKIFAGDVTKCLQGA
jgi:hypothetical protein